MKMNIAARSGLTLFAAIVLMLLLAACGSTAAPTATPDTSVPPQGTPTDLPPPPAYREPTQSVSALNASQFTLLGRLDVAGTTSSIYSFAFSPDGTRLAALNSDLLFCWNLTTGGLLFSGSSHGANQVYYSPDKTEIYAINPDGFVVVYREDGTEITSFSASDDYNDVSAFYAADGWMALGGNNGDVKIWNPMDRTSLVTIEAHSKPIERLVFSADGTRLLTAGNEANVKLWDWRNRTVLQTFDLAGGIFKNMVLSPDGTHLAVGTDKAVMVFDTANGERGANMPVSSPGATAVLRYTPDGRYLVTAGGDDGMILWNPANGVSIGRLPDVHGSRVSAAFSPGGDLMVTGVLDQAAALWNLTEVTGQGIPRIGLDAGTRRIVNTGWSDDGYVVAFFDAAGPVYIMGVPAPTQ